MIRVLVAAVAVCAGAFAQKLDPVRWTLDIDPARAGGIARGHLTAVMEPGWHLYSLTAAPPVNPTRFTFPDNPAVASVDVFVPKPRVAFDPNFQQQMETYEEKAEFLLNFHLKPNEFGKVPVTVLVRYQVCDATRCLPPVRRTPEAVMPVDASAPDPPPIPAGYEEFKPRTAPAGTTATAPGKAPSGDLFTLIPVAFGWGLLAIFTPCVFPMIPITMSFFLNRPQGSRGQALGHAALFCLGIILLFTTIGLAVTAAVGPFGVVQLGSNVWVNGFIAALFLVFALSLLGAFEITIPSSVLTRLNRESERGGMLGTLVMGLAFSLSSFACIGPFVGPLLAAAAQSGKVQPVVGMASFAAGLSAPFFLLAAFPSYLRRLPRAGGWLPRVKIVMGFVLLAILLKYVSSIDQVMQWNVLTRERFLALWIVLFSMPGLYLLGFLRMEGVSREQDVSLGRLLTGIAFLAFAISLVPGIWGTPLGELDAYVPLPSRSGFTAAKGAPAQLAWSKNNLKEALARAKAEGKHVFVNFTGYACTNCHWMKANMFTRPEIAEAMNRFVLVELYTDGSDPSSERNQRLQESRFQTISIPYYAILDGNDKVMATFPGLTRNPEEFLAFLNQGAAKPL
ncbi:MAG: cytochrome c biogenesis protein CcdA [Bryobacteraceae bacterium]